MDAWFFLLQAERLIEGCQTGPARTPGAGGVAANVRTAVSRSYYAAHLTAKAFLTELGYRVAGVSDSHTTVQRGVRNGNEPELVQAASELGILATERRRADYDLHDARIEAPSRAAYAAALSKSVINLVRAASLRAKSDPAFRSQIIAALDAWRVRDSVHGLRKM